MKRRLAIVASLGVFAFAATAHGEPLVRGALALEWSAPGGCPNGVEVVERIEALLGGPIANLRPDPISARGKVRELEPLRFELELETVQHDQRFARSMQAPSCTELADAGALVLALAIDPTLAERQAHAKEGATAALAPLPPTAPPSPPPPPPVPVQNLDGPDPVDAPPQASVSTDGTAPEWATRVGLVLDLGTVADLGYGPALTVAAGFGAFRAELGVLWLFPQRTVIANEPTRGGAVDLVASDLGGCFRPLRGDLEVQGCATLELGRIHGAGFGTVVEAEQSAFWLATGVDVSGRFRAAGALFVGARAGVLYNPQDTEFTLENVGLVHRVPAAVGRFGVSIESEFE